MTLNDIFVVGRILLHKKNVNNIDTFCIFFIKTLRCILVSWYLGLTNEMGWSTMLSFIYEEICAPYVNYIIGDKKEVKAFKYVVKHAKEGDALSVLNTLDTFARNKNWMMNIGELKADVITDVIKSHNVKTIVELGAYVGYSAISFASLLPPGYDSHYYSFELDPLYAAISTKMLDFAGLKEKSTVIIGAFEKRHEILQERYGLQGKVDMFFIDHAKEKYLSDFKLIEHSGLCRKGTVIVADNLGYPGAPGYLDYVQSHEKLETIVIDATLEYLNIPDKIAISVVKEDIL